MKIEKLFVVSFLALTSLIFTAKLAKADCTDIMAYANDEDIMCYPNDVEDAP